MFCFYDRILVGLTHPLRAAFKNPRVRVSIYEDNIGHSPRIPLAQLACVCPGLSLPHLPRFAPCAMSTLP